AARVLGGADDVGEAADAGGGAAAGRDVEDRLGEIGEAVEVGGAAGQDHAGGDGVEVAAAQDLGADVLEELLDPGLDDLDQEPPRQGARVAAADGGDLHGLLGADEIG